jgi:hypothetical protein
MANMTLKKPRVDDKNPIVFQVAGSFGNPLSIHLVNCLNHLIHYSGAGTTKCMMLDGGGLCFVNLQSNSMLFFLHVS